jgi:hypothetical protein
MSKVKTMTIDIMENNYLRKTLFKVLFSALIILGIMYIYFIGSITFNVLARKSLETTVRTLGSNISNLELTYLNNLNEIDKDYAETKGFVDANDNIFATRSISHVAIR